MKRIPISAAKRIAEDYGYDQVMIYARKVDPDGGEHMTTYGVSKAHCNAMAKIAKFLQTTIMGWTEKTERPMTAVTLIEELQALATAGHPRRIDLRVAALALYDAQDKSYAEFREVFKNAERLLKECASKPYDGPGWDDPAAENNKRRMQNR